MKKSFLILPAVAFLASCAGSDSYTVKMTVPEDIVGKTAFIVEAQNGRSIDSVEISSPEVVFKGKIEEPTLAMVVVGGYPYAQFALEPGTITMTDDGLATGTPANDAFSDYNNSIAALVDSLQHAPEVQQSQIMKQLVNSSVDFIVANPDSPFALPVFGQVAMEMEPQQIQNVIDASPSLAQDPDVQRSLSMANARVNTSAGHKYVDLTVEYDGTEQRLSDYVVPGKWTLVDFWASWCGPCRREIPGIKALYDKYKAQGLNVVGVAVRDEPANTKQAMEEAGVNWPVIMNGGMDVLEAYGIMGIPCIMLINPEGVIVARDLFGQQLADAVTEAMESTQK